VLLTVNNKLQTSPKKVGLISSSSQLKKFQGLGTTVENFDGKKVLIQNWNSHGETGNQDFDDA